MRLRIQSTFKQEKKTMAATILFDGAGALPQTFTFNSPYHGPATFVLSGTAWTQKATTLLQIALQLDGVTIGKTSMCWANQAAIHMTLRPTFIPVPNLIYGPHKMSIIVANTTTVTDINDYFQVTLL
jgi:hypothetical protein